MTDPLPHIPWGTHISLRAGNWFVEPNVPASHTIEVRVVAVQQVTADVVSIDAHGLDCTWQSVNCQEPWCIQVLAPLAVLAEAAATL